MTEPKNYKGNSIEKFQKTSEPDSITILRSEIKTLEQEISDLKQKLQPFQNLIYDQLQNEIRQLAMLSELHKKYRADKKQKRREQKQRGKNYKAPQSTIKNSNKKTDNQVNKNTLNPELKKLYREAVIKINPDKISHNSKVEAIQAATDLTSKLNELYKNGDLNELKFFYYSISDGESNPTVKNDNSNIKDFKNVLVRTQQKLMAELDALKASSQFYYLSANKQPQEFVDDLRQMLLAKIKKLEKRTKKN